MAVTLVLYGLGLVFVAATLLPFSRHEAWWIRACDFPRLQIATGLAAVLILALIAGDPGAGADQLLMVTLSACLAYQLAVILPYTRLWRPELLASATAPAERKVSLLVVNVLMSNRQADRLLEMVREHAPDLILALEVDDWWCEQFATLADAYPCRIVHPLDNTYGLLVYARLELIDPELRFLLEPEIPSLRTEVALRSGAMFVLYGLHPSRRRPGRPTPPCRATPSSS